MTRTRRIEVIRYRRRVTLTSGESDVNDSVLERDDTDLVLDVLEVVEPPLDVKVDRLMSAHPAHDYPVRRGSLRRLWDLLRLRR